MDDVEAPSLAGRIQKYLLKLYWLLERWIVPGLEWSDTVYARTVSAHVDGETRWLDIGCGHRLWWSPGQEDAARRAALIVGLDPDIASLRKNTIVDHRVAGLILPFRDGSFNLVTANMVVEHVEHPLAFLQEIRRVLAPNGVCILHTPNAQNWQIAAGRHLPQTIKHLLIRWTEGRAEQDVYPTWYRLNTARALREHVAAAGFESPQLILINTHVPGAILLFGPLVVLQLLWIRLTHRPSLQEHRNNIVCVLRAHAVNSTRAESLRERASS